MLCDDDDDDEEEERDSLAVGAARGHSRRPLAFKPDYTLLSGNYHRREG